MLKLLIVSILLNIVSFSLENVAENSSRYGDKCPDAIKKFEQNLLLYSTKLLKSYTKSTRDTGGFSGLAELFHLAALAVFAEGETKKELYRILHLANKYEIYCVADYLIQEAVGTPECVKSLPSIDIYANIDYVFTPEFVNTMNLTILRNLGVVRNIDFSNYQAADEINEQVANNTNNNVPTVIEDPSIFNNDTQMVFVTGLSFTGEWEIEMQSTKKVTEFRESPTKSQPQTFLYQDAVYLYGHSNILRAQVVQVNFCCGIFNMWVIRPDCPFTEDVLIAQMAKNIDWYYEMLKNMTPTRLDLYLPMNNRSTDVNMKPLLRKTTKIRTIYNEKIIDLKGVIENDEPAAVSVSIQTLYHMTSYKGGPVPNEPLSNIPKRTVKFNYPHVWLIFRNGRVHYIGATRRAT